MPKNSIDKQLDRQFVIGYIIGILVIICFGIALFLALSGGYLLSNYQIAQLAIYAPANVCNLALGG
jgi:hypothetical protein